MKKVALLILTTLFLLISAVPSMATNSNDKVLPSGLKYDMLSQTIENFVAEHLPEVPGAAVAVFDKNGLLYENWFGWADAENKIPMNADTVIEWGSVTKLLLWVSVMQLWEQGELDLEADINTYLPDGFLRKLRYETPVSMLDLMNHRAGFEESFLKLYTFRETDIISLEEYLQTVQPEQVFEPGTMVAYSNWGVALAGYIVEQISGLPYWRYVHENIFMPLEMNHSSIYTDLSDNLSVKEQHKLLNSYGESNKSASNIQYFIAYPAGACVSTLSDFAIFAQALLPQNSVLFKSPQTWKTMFSPTEFYGDTGVPMCFHGFFQDNVRFSNVIWHNGGTAGYSSNMLLNLDAEVGMVVASNCHAETNFNRKLPQLIFGKEDGESYIQSIPDGFYFLESCRNIFFGPLKLYRLFCIQPLSSLIEDADHTIAYTENSGIPRISIVACDLLVRSVWNILPLYSSVILWLISLLFSFALLLAILVHAIYRKKFCVLDKSIALICALELLPLSLIGVIISLTTQQWPIWCYRLWCVSNGLVFLALCVCTGITAFNIMKKKIVIRWKQLPILLLASEIISIWNLFYWELFAYWKI